MKHFLSTEDWQQSELQSLLDQANALKQTPWNDHLRHRSIALLFFNPSLRTKTSFELGIQQMGGVAVVLQPGQGAWGIEFEPGVVMDGDAEEHIKEVAQVLSSYVDMIAIRSFPEFKDWSYDRQDPKIKAFAKHASVPVINMETIVHPCQELAMMMTIQNHLGQPKGKNFLLTWVPHPKPLNTAVANSALLMASKFGMNITLLCPNKDYILDSHFMDTAQTQCQQHGSQLNISHNVSSAYQGADFVYAKSWGALPFYGDMAHAKQSQIDHQHFMVDSDKMQQTNQAKFSHCLPLRRNVKASDEVLDADYCVAIEEAENRLHVQKALMMKMMGVTGAQS